MGATLIFINPFTALMSLEYYQYKREIWNPSAFFVAFFALACERIFI